MSKNTTQKNKVAIPEQDWWLFCDSYLATAELACREMLFQRYGKHMNLDFDDNYGNNKKAFNIQNLYIPMRYNLNHAIEIFLKSFLIVLEKQNPQYRSFGHDIGKCLTSFQDKIQLQRIKQDLKEAYDQAKQSPYNIEIISQISDFSDDWLDSVVKISLKYFHCHDIQVNANQVNLYDEKNDAFRYPDNNIKAKVNYINFVKQLSNYEVRNILSDIRELKVSFGNLKVLIYAYQSVK